MKKEEIQEIKGEAVPTETTELSPDDIVDVKEVKKVKKSPFVVSIIFTVLALILLLSATLVRIIGFNSLINETENAGEAIANIFAIGIVGVLFLLFALILDVVGLIFSIVGFSTAATYFKKIKNAASITMFVISLLTLIYAIAFIPLALFVF